MCEGEGGVCEGGDVCVSVCVGGCVSVWGGCARLGRDVKVVRVREGCVRGEMCV